MLLHLIWAQRSRDDLICFLERFPSGSEGKESACKEDTQAWYLSQEDPLEKVFFHFDMILMKSREAEKINVCTQSTIQTTT